MAHGSGTRTRRSGQKKNPKPPPIHAVCRDPEIPDLDSDPARDKNKIQRLHQLGTDISIAFKKCTGDPGDGADYIDPRTALAILLFRLSKTNLDLATIYGSALSQRVGFGSDGDTDEMAKKVAWSLYQAADHNMRLETRFKGMDWVRSHPESPVGDPLVRPCAPVSVPDVGDDAHQDDKIERLHQLGRDVSAAFEACTGAQFWTPDYLDGRIALAILLVYLASTNLALIEAQGSALGGVPGHGATTDLDRSAKFAAQKFLGEADHNVRMHVRYKGLA